MKIRRRLGLSQQEFWSRIGVTQSVGSRYERGRRMPKPVQELLRIVHIERIDLSRIDSQDFDAVELLKTQQPDSYTCLHLQAAAKPGKRREKQPAPASKNCPLRMSGVECLPTTRKKCRQWWHSVTEKWA